MHDKLKLPKYFTRWDRNKAAYDVDSNGDMKITYVTRRVYYHLKEDDTYRTILAEFKTEAKAQQFATKLAVNARKSSKRNELFNSLQFDSLLAGGGVILD